MRRIEPHYRPPAGTLWLVSAGRLGNPKTFLSNGLSAAGNLSDWRTPGGRNVDIHIARHICICLVPDPDYRAQSYVQSGLDLGLAPVASHIPPMELCATDGYGPSRDLFKMVLFARDQGVLTREQAEARLEAVRQERLAMLTPRQRAAIFRRYGPAPEKMKTA